MKKGTSDKDKKKGAESEDQRLWKEVTRSVTPYTKEKRKPVATPDIPAVPKTAAKKTSLAPAKPPAAKPPAAKPPALAASRPFLNIKPAPLPAAGAKAFDQGTADKMRKGKLPPEGSIDLHGMTQEEALRALRRSISGAIRQGKRTLLVITGKGRVSGGGGVLRRMVPLWLEETDLRAQVIAYTTAAPRDGGDGALYVRLRKPKK